MNCTPLNRTSHPETSACPSARGQSSERNTDADLVGLPFVAGTRDRHVVVVGLGNIGSQLVTLLARSQHVRSLSLVDSKHYARHNLMQQDIGLRDVGRPKARVLARRAKQCNPDLAVEAFVGRVEEAPLGALRADVMIGAVDSRRSRMTLNATATRLGIPLIDTGIDATGELARVSLFDPSSSPESPCLECMWTDADYAAVEHAYPCAGAAVEASAGSAPEARKSPAMRGPRTNAPMRLGAIAAALAEAECEKLLAGDRRHALVGRQVLIDVRHHRHYVTTMRRNPDCRFDHDAWRLVPWRVDPRRTTLADAFDFVSLALQRSETAFVGDASASPSSLESAELHDEPDAIVLRHSSERFAARLICPGCRVERSVLRLAGRIHSRQSSCSTCRGEMESIAFYELERLDRRSISPRELRLPLSRFGLQLGDVVEATSSAARTHVLLSAMSPPTANLEEQLHE